MQDERDNRPAQAAKRDVDSLRPTPYMVPSLVNTSALARGSGRNGSAPGMNSIKVINSLKTAKLREKGCQIVRRRGRVYVINKKQPRYKARQG